MDVDSPSSNSSGSLKRSSSAPMINELNSTMTTVSSTTTRDTSFNVLSNSRLRRFSASFSPLHGVGSSSSPRMTPRVSQLRQEECLDAVGREAALERELHSAMTISQSWEDLSLTDMDVKGDGRRMSRSVLDPLHLHLPQCPPQCSSPSPTRSLSGSVGRQCFSPSMQMAVRSSPSPSPTRKAFTTRRSLSPIAMRPSSLGAVKRKCELEDDKVDGYLSPPAKRPSYYSLERGGLLIPHSLANSLETTPSPIPGSLSSVGTPESLSSADSPGFTFRPVDSPGSMATDPSPVRTVSMSDQPQPMGEKSMVSSGPSRQGSVTMGCDETLTDEPMHEELSDGQNRNADISLLSKHDHVMTSVDQNSR